VTKRISDDSFYDEYNILWEGLGNYGYTPIKFPLADSVIEDLNKLTWLDPYDPERVKGLRKEIKELDENTDYTIVGDVICRGPFEIAIKYGVIKYF